MANRNPYNHPDYKRMKNDIRKAKLGIAPYLPCSLRLNGCTHQAEVPDHKTPLARGGAWTKENLQPACAHCNASKSGGRKNKKSSKKPFQNRG